MENVIGHWVVSDCVPNTCTGSQKGIEGVMFELCRAGEVRWQIPSGTVALPLLSCDTYEVVTRDGRGHYQDKAYIRFGTYRGHILDFHLDTHHVEAGELVISKGLWLIRCKKTDPLHTQESAQSPFSFVAALEDGYFADLHIIAANSKTFGAHSCILKLSAPDLDWSAQPPPLTGLPEEVLGTALHYLYAQCVPAGLPARTAELVVTLLADMPQLQSLRTLCQSYLSHLTLKNRILEVMGEVHGCLTRMTDGFQQRNAQYDPGKLCHLVRRSMRDAAVAYAKLMLVSHLYHEKKSELTAEAGQEVIRYIQSRGPVILSQLKAFVVGVSSVLNGLDSSHRVDLSCYLVPELEMLLETLLLVLGIVEGAVEAMLQQSLKQEEAFKMLSPLEQDVNRLLTNKEIVRFDCFLGRVTCMQEHIIQIKENFKELSSGNKVRSLGSNLDQVIGELPVLVLRLDQFAAALDLKFECSDSQFCFKVGTAKVCEMVHKLVKERAATHSGMLRLCQLVDREAFTSALIELGLLDAKDAPPVHADDPKTNVAPPTPCGYMLNLTAGLCASPNAADNPLSLAAQKLLESETDTDMVFEVMEENSVVTIAAHRVIVAARCDWFRRALLSGMQEDIQRRIQVHNTSQQLVRTLLRYLYTGKVAAHTLTTAHLIELLLLSDCYEIDSLKSKCEQVLLSHIRDETVVELLDLTDHLSAMPLRTACIKFISEHRSVLNHESFADLSLGLQSQVYDAVRLTTGSCMCTKQWRKTDGEQRGEPEGQAEDSGVYKLVDTTSTLQINR